MRKFGLIGYPLGHSFSPGYFTDKFKKEGIDAIYDGYAIPEAAELIDLLTNDELLVGLNVTIPHKQAVMPLLNELDDTAAKIGAVNVIKVKRVDGKLHLKGFNSDCIGFERSFEKLLKPNHTKALVLGTGGAAKAVYYTLDKLGIKFKKVSRQGGDGKLSYDELKSLDLNDFPVIINCTPLGMAPNIDVAPDLNYDQLTEANYLYDLVYNPMETLFLKRGKERGATICNGIEMLHLQAEAGWEIWNDINR